MWRKILSRLWPPATDRRSVASMPRRPDLDLARIDSLQGFQDWRRTAGEELERHRRLERELMRTPEEAPFGLRGHCYVCDVTCDLRVDYLYSVDQLEGRPVPNWRERLLCPHCGLNNRMRATVHLFEAMSAPSAGSSIYLTEQVTPLYACFSRRYPNVVGSEYLGDACPLGQTGPNGWRNEDLTALSFADESFDALVCLDVFEHVPDYEAAFRECHRVLKPGGSLMVTVPFRVDRQENLVRARVGEDGEIEHLMEPEYHGDPLDGDGCLAFYHYGWELLDRFRDAGFASAESYVYWSRYWGYLGEGQTYHLARKS